MVRSAIGLLLVACVGTHVAAADIIVQEGYRHVFWECGSDYIGGSMGEADMGGPDGVWLGELTKHLPSSDGLLSLDMHTNQNSTIGGPQLFGDHTTSAIVQPAEPLVGTKVGAYAEAAAVYEIRFTVTEETPVQFSSAYYSLDATLGGTASLAVELQNRTAWTMVYEYYDSVTDGHTSGSVMSDVITLYPGTLYAVKVTNDATSLIDIVEPGAKPVEAYSNSSYSLAIVPEPTSLLMLLGGLFAAARRR